ncbi:MAG: hypothetical protein AAF550_13595 [Myxococcota bacterium]
MILTLLKTTLSLFVLFCVGWFFFMVPLGERTLFEHCWRISKTDEARELGREFGEAGSRLVDQIGNRIEEQNSDAEQPHPK